MISHDVCHMLKAVMGPLDSATSRSLQAPPPLPQPSSGHPHDRPNKHPIVTNSYCPYTLHVRYCRRFDYWIETMSRRFFCHNTFGSVQTSKEVQILKPLAPVLNVGAWVHCGNKTQHTLIMVIAWNYPFFHGNSTSLLLKGDLDVSISSDAAQYPHYLSCLVVPSHNTLRNVPWHGT